MVQIFVWLKNFQTSIIFISLFSDSLPKSKAKENKKLFRFENFQTKEKFEPQHTFTITVQVVNKIK